MLTSFDVKFICDSACLSASLRDKIKAGVDPGIFYWQGPKLWYRKDC